MTICSGILARVQTCRGTKRYPHSERHGPVSGSSGPGQPSPHPQLILKGGGKPPSHRAVQSSSFAPTSRPSPAPMSPSPHISTSDDSGCSQRLLASRRDYSLIIKGKKGAFRMKNTWSKERLEYLSCLPQSLPRTRTLDPLTRRDRQPRDILRDRPGRPKSLKTRNLRKSQSQGASRGKATMCHAGP